MNTRSFVVAMLLAFGGGFAIAPLAAQQGDARAQIFVARRCNECHSVWAIGVKAKSDVGPDLTFAYVDVVNRYGRSLESFLYRPSGIMELMLASHLQLSVADRDSILVILTRIYREHRAQLEEQTLPIAAQAARSAER